MNRGLNSESGTTRIMKCEVIKCGNVIIRDNSGFSGRKVCALFHVGLGKQSSYGCLILAADRKLNVMYVYMGAAVMRYFIEGKQITLVTADKTIVFELLCNIA